ncbi:MAG: hypothetical protein WAT39_05950 [Planctomycetota bacterium]
MRIAPALLFAAAAAATAVAQTLPNLIAPTLSPTLNNIQIHQSVHGTCTPLSICGTGLVPSPNFYWAGGSAWDSSSNALWVTNGTLLGRYGMNGCSLQCGPIPCPRSPLSEATGLDLHDGNNQLWVIDSGGWITQCTNSCPPAVINSWNTGLALAGNVATTAIAIDEIRGLIFYSTADFGAGSGRIYAALLSNPGAWFQFTPTFDCLPVPVLITGIACDAARGELYWTNGRGTHRWSYIYNPAGPSVAFTPGTCCLNLAPFFEPYTDLSIRWGAATSTGGPCANGSCPPCPMVHLLRNAPLLGTTLQLGLDSAPVGAIAVCAVDFGACNPTGPVPPPFCGPILVPLTAAMLIMGPNITVNTGGGVCGGSTTFPLALPGNPALVGTPLASQCAVLCAPSGTALSNCLSWVLQ